MQLSHLKIVAMKSNKEVEAFDILAKNYFVERIFAYSPTESALKK
jgi:hypothetical protein